MNSLRKFGLCLLSEEDIMAAEAAKQQVIEEKGEFAVPRFVAALSRSDDPKKRAWVDYFYGIIR